MQRILSHEDLREPLAVLYQDPVLAPLKGLGPPPLWLRPEGFATLLHIILEQQVSLASAKVAFERLQEAAAPLTPARFLELDDATLKRVGFSRQKTRYGRALANAVSEGRLELETLALLENEAVRATLTALPGIGLWTANIYLMMALGRLDIWPQGDLALAVAARELMHLDERPSQPELALLARRWRPYRSVAARLLWHYYLSR